MSTKLTKESILVTLYSLPLCLQYLTINQNDLTNLKSTLDLRFTKLEKTVEKIHNDFKVKLFEGIDDDGQENKNRKESLTLNFEKENAAKTSSSKVKKEEDPHWNEVH